MESFRELVKSVHMTKTNRLIAEYCLNNQSTVAFQSAAELAEKIGVSDVSIVRFARALGYEGFVDLKRAWQEELCQSIDSDAASSNNVAKYLTRRESHQENSNFRYDNAIDPYTNMVRDVLTANPPEIIHQVAEKLRASDGKYIVGIRSRYAVASLMAFLLRMALPNVVQITQADYQGYQKMLDLTDRDCVVFFTFGRYSLFEQSLLQRVKDSGAYLIVVTDKRASRAALAADLLLYSAGDINQHFYSSVGNTVLLECIASAVAEEDWPESRKRIEALETYLSKSELKK